ncbi:MAG: methionine adenosyltransferase [Deltaproteobacteria bacterium]|nr:methionine adenosyltransferase [Deltaproteobacteria bacterium]
MYLFTSEAVSPGHPDKCADIIADSIVDALLQIDPGARVATEVFIVGKNIIIGGEVKTSARVDDQFYKEVAKKALSGIGYPERRGFDRGETLYPDETNIQVFVSRQSPDISIGVDKESGEIGAGDQGMMFGYATIEREDFMPAALMYAREIRDALYEYARSRPGEFGVDLKTQVTLDYGNKENFDACRPQKISKIVVAISHSKDLAIEKVQNKVRKIIEQTVRFPKGFYDPDETEFFIDQTGKFVTHGPIADSGLSGRKVVCDTYGGYAPTGGGSQSSKDYTKVDRSGLYAARWLAKHIVAAGLSRKAVVEIAYVIGRGEPISVTVDTLHTALTDLNDEELSVMIAEKFPLTPQWINGKFGLDAPGKDRFLYADIAAKGQVGYAHYPWEKLDELSWFKSLTESVKCLK